jgi:hypothetical protein
MIKRKNKTSYDEWVEPSYIIGTGQYQRIGDAHSETRMKHDIGFIRNTNKPHIKRRPRLKVA